MSKKRIASFLAIFLLWFLITGADAQEKQSAEETIVGDIVGHNGKGIVQANGNCRQTIIVRTTANSKRHQEAKYIVVRHESDCLEAIPEQKLKARHEWRFSLIRKVNCDEMLDSLMYLRQHSPTGGEMPKIELLWLLPGVKAEEIPADKKLPCYSLGSAGFEPVSEPVRR